MVDGYNLVLFFLKCRLGSWLAFQAMGDDAMVMGDLVLTQDEVNPVMKRLVDGGIEITALHNHLLPAEPATMYMYVGGHGDPVKLAETLHAAKTPLEQKGAATSSQSADLDTAMLDETLGHAGKANGGIYQFTIPRAETIMDSRMTVPISTGTGIAINFSRLATARRRSPATSF
jgi:hypothetical protein